MSDDLKVPKIMIPIMKRMRLFGGSCIVCSLHTYTFGIFKADKEGIFASPYKNERGETFERFFPYFICNDCLPKSDTDTETVDRIEKIIYEKYLKVLKQ